MARYSRRQLLTLATAGTGWSLARLRQCVAGARWRDRRTFGPFHCSAGFPLAPLSGLFDEVAEIDRELQRTLGLPPVSTPVDVYLLADERSHRALLEQIYPRVPYRRALYIQRGRQGAVFAFRHPDLATDLRHECTHALLHANLPMVPLWLDEGLAEYYEPPATHRAFHHPHFASLRWNLRLGRLRTVRSLEQERELKDMGAVDYRSAWAWVHFMLHGPATAHAELVRFLADVRRGDPPGQLSDRLHSAVPDLDRRVFQHFKHWRRV
ncbi:MAG: hypothetical protein AAF961_06490 [Planctomycetota bacterium]